MLTKEFITKSFNDEDLKHAIQVYEKYKLAYEKGITVFVSNFYPPNIWAFFEKYSTLDCLIESSGIFKDSERRVISFNNTYGVEYPIRVLEVENKSNFSTLKHKDYLGAILSLGIERCKLGDIIVSEDKAYIPTLEGIEKYIVDNLTQIGKSPINIKTLEDISLVPIIQFEDIIIRVSSLRLDSVVAKIANISRNNAIELIDAGKVLIDYTKAKERSQDARKGTRLTIRGYGKFIVSDIIGTTKKEKQIIQIKKYK